jgi:hypothetical protein
MHLLRPISVLGMTASLVVAGQVTDASAEPQRVGLTLAPVSNAALTAPIRNTFGSVKSLSRQVLTLDIGGRDIAFIVDENTDVLAKGAGKATRNAGGSLPITALVHRGDIARVGYRELNGALRAVEVQVKGRNTIASR